MDEQLAANATAIRERMLTVSLPIWAIIEVLQKSFRRGSIHEHMRIGI